MLIVNRSFIWEILKNTLSKVNSRVVQVKAKLDNFETLHEANKLKRAESEPSDSKINLASGVLRWY
jgi:nuclear cap-binding protein subunit 1